MSFEPKTFDQIYAELVQSTQARLPGEVDLEVGSVVRTLYESFAYEMALLYEQMDQVYRSAFIDTASGLQLEMVAAILGIQRGLPDFAEGGVTFERDPGNDDLEIPLGTLVTTEDSDQSPRKAYKTLETKTLPANATQVTVKVQALERGEHQTVEAEKITVMPLPVAGVKAVRNLEPTQFLGKRLETDADLRQRAKSMLLASGKASLTSIETALLSLPGVREVKLVEPFEPPVSPESSSARQPGPRRLYGVLDVYVDDSNLDRISEDGDFLGRETQRFALLRQHIDQVRAAGVYVRLQAAQPVVVDSLVQLEVNSAVDRDALTTAVRGAIATHFTQLRLGLPLLFPPLTQALLAVEGVKNVEEFGLIPRHQGQRLRAEPFYSRDKRIQPSQDLVASKFRLGQLMVLTGTQPLPVAVEFRASALTAETVEAVNVALTELFAGLAVGQRLTHQAVLAALPEAIAVVPESLMLMPQNPSLLASRQGEGVQPSFAERLVLAEPVLAYSTEIDLVGALRFTPAEPATEAERQQIIAALRDRITTYLNALAPEQAVTLTELHQAVNGNRKVDLPGLNPQDFRVLLNGVDQNRLDPDAQRLLVNPLERVRATYLILSDRTVPLTVAITALEVTITPLPIAASPPAANATEPEPPEETRAAREAREAQEAREAAAQQLTRLTGELKVALAAAVGTFPALEPGQALTLGALRQHLETAPDRPNQFRGLAFTLTGLALTATSVDGRVQVISLATAPTLHVRSLEQIQSLAPLDPDTITTVVSNTP